MESKKNKICYMCGVIYTPTSNNQIYCPKCRIIAKGIYDIRAYEKKKIERSIKKYKNNNKKVKKALAEVKAYNEKNGTNYSYGRYYAMKFAANISNKK